MKNLFNKKQVIIISILLLLTTYLRFFNVGDKIYTSDEVRGLMRFSGYTEAEFLTEVYNGKPITVQQIQQYQVPNSSKNIIDAGKALAGNPEHPPLYYMMSRFVSQLTNDPTGARYLAVIFSLITFPCLYWLCLELFQSHFVALVAIAIFAASPFHFRLAQEARQYSLWTVTILTSCASLLRALRLNNRNSWLIYGGSVALGMYSHLFFAWVAIAHSFYLLCLEKFSWKSKILRNYLGVNLIAIVLFSPWIFVILTSVNIVKKKTRWVSSFKAPLELKLQYWFGNLGGIFIDFQNYLKANYFLHSLILILVIYSIYFLCKNTPIKVWSFLLFILAFSALTQVIPDVISGGRRSLLDRYLMPSYLSIQLAVAYLFATQIETLNKWRRKAYLIGFSLLISLGFLSCFFASQKLDWWKATNAMNLDVIPILNNEEKPFVISDNPYYTYMLSMSHLLKPDITFQLFNLKENEQDKLEEVIPLNNINNTYLYLPSEKLEEVIKKTNNYQLEKIAEASPYGNDQKVTLLSKIAKK